MRIIGQEATIRIFLTMAIFLLGIAPTTAGTGFYMGQWTPAELDCSAKTIPQRLVINQLTLQSGVLTCKFLGISENTDVRMTFKALCNDNTLKWQDEISLSATEQALILKFKTENIERRYNRCVQLLPPKTEVPAPVPGKKKKH